MKKTNSSGLSQRKKLLAGMNGVATTVLFGSVCPYAFAQATVSSGGTLEEIIVTARRRSEMISEVPLAITAFTPEALEEKSIIQFTDLAKTVPGFTISTAGSSTATPVIALRGQRPSETLMTLDPAVPLYFADVVIMPTFGTNLAMYDLADVQVLKGPQGTLFGKNSTGGAVLLTPQAPTNQFEGYVKGTLGNYNLYRVEGAVSVPVNDALGFRIAGQKTERDGYQSNVANNSANCNDCLWDENSSGMRLVANLDLDGFSNQLTASYNQDRSANRIGVPTAFNAGSSLGGLIGAVWGGGAENPAINNAIAEQADRSPFDVAVNFIPKQVVRNTFVANTTEYDLNDNYTIKNIFGYNKVHYYEEQDTDGTPLGIFGSIITRTSAVPVGLDLPNGKEVNSEQFSDEIQLAGLSFDDKLEWIAGAYWSRLRGSEDFLSALVGANPTNPLIPFLPASVQGPATYGMYQGNSGEVVNESYAIFGEGVYDLTDDWSVTLGLRQTWDSRELTVHNTATSPFLPSSVPQCTVRAEGQTTPLPNDACSRTVDESFSSPTWRLASNYKLTPTQLVYGSISTGYRTGGFNLRGTSDATLEPFDEETVLNYEVGHKADWNVSFLGNVRTAVALYWQEYSDIQKTTAIADGASFGTATINAAEAVIRGAEFDITVAPTNDLSFSLAYSYVDAYYKNWDSTFSYRVGSTPASVTLDTKDSPFVFIPESSVTASARYTLPLDPSIGKVSLLTSVYWQSSMETHNYPQLFTSSTFQTYFGYSNASVLQAAKKAQKTDAYDIWNFRVSWQGMLGSNFDSAIFVNNAFDEEYVVGGSNILDSLGLAGSVYGEPRTFGGSVQWNF